MKSRFYLLGLAFVLGATIVSGCVPPTAQTITPPDVVVKPTLTPIPEGGHVTPVDASPEAAGEAPDAVRARDVALAIAFERF